MAAIAPGITPYRFGFNNPISQTDPSGLYEIGLNGMSVPAWAGGNVNTMFNLSQGYDVYSADITTWQITKKNRRGEILDQYTEEEYRNLKYLGSFEPPDEDRVQTASVYGGGFVSKEELWAEKQWIQNRENPHSPLDPLYYLFEVGRLGRLALNGFDLVFGEASMLPTPGMITRVSALTRAQRIAKVAKRPSRYRKGVVDKVWKNAQNKKGKVYDPYTREELIWDQNRNRHRQWDMGHRQGRSYNDLKNDYIDGNISWKKFLDEYNNPDNYHPQSYSSNRSRVND